jgi:hypothetical protein
LALPGKYVYCHAVVAMVRGCDVSLEAYWGKLAMGPSATSRRGWKGWIVLRR